MTDQPVLHSSIVAMVSLAAGIAANHPSMGRCQMQRLRDAGVPEAHIATVVDIARHIRGEAAEKLDTAFDEAEREMPVMAPVAAASSSCCGTTAAGNSCC